MGSQPITITPDQQIAITPDQPQAAPEKPGLWQRFREGVGLPSLDDLKATMSKKPSASDIALGPVGTAAGIIKNYAQTAGKGIKEGYNEVKDAAQNDIDAGRTLPSMDNMGKALHGVLHAGLQSIPFIGPAVENVGNDVADNNVRGAVGGAAGVLTQAALLHSAPDTAASAAEAPGKVKAALSIPPEVKAAAGEVPDLATASAAARTSKEINAGATQELQGKLHAEFDAAAKHAGADVSDAPSVSVKAHRIGDKLQQDAQAMYQKADDIAKQVTGQPGRFQQFQQDIKGLRDQIRSTYDPTIKANLEQQLGTAQAQYAQYQSAMESAGMDTKFVKQADKQWSIGTSYKEVGHKLATGELLNGDLRPTASPLNNAVKSISKEGAKRGHVLENAMGDKAVNVTDAVNQAANRVQSETAQTRAAKQTAKETQARAAEAQKRIDRVRANRKTVAKGAAAALGVGGLATGAYTYAGALHGKSDD